MQNVGSFANFCLQVNDSAVVRVRRTVTKEESFAPLMFAFSLSLAVAG
jgi:hypothetical protein